MSMVDQMSQSGIEIRRPTNPCETDMQRTRCLDAACLKSHVQSLSPSCSAFLIKTSMTARPSPSPLPQATSFFSYSYTGKDGEMHTESGKMNTKEGKEIEGEMMNMMEAIMPSFGALFGLEEPTPQPRRAEPRQAPKSLGAPSSHPCEWEVQSCAQELNGVTAREPLQQCLVKHYAELTAECKCFLHQVMGPELEKQVPAVKAVEEQRIRTVAVIERLQAPAEAPMGRDHRLTCALFMGILMVSTVLVVRRLLLCCCTTKLKNVAFVPPDQGTVKMSIEPLVASKEIK